MGWSESIYSHEQEHEIMAKSGANNYLGGPRFSSYSDYVANLGRIPVGPLWINGYLGYYDGSELKMNPVILGNSGVKVNLTGTTSATLLATVTLPDGIMGPNSAIQIEPAFNWTSSVNNKTVTVSVGQTLGGATTIFTRTRTTTGDLPLIRFVNRGVQNSQIEVFSGLGTYGANSASFLVENTRTIDYSLSGLNIYITGTLANSGESIDLNALMVSVINAYR